MHETTAVCMYADQSITSRLRSLNTQMPHTTPSVSLSCDAARVKVLEVEPSALSLVRVVVWLLVPSLNSKWDYPATTDFVKLPNTSVR